MSVKDRIKALARDLTSLEVNTIRRASITGESMPDPRHALHDVAQEYNSALNDLLKGDSRRIEGADCVLSCRFAAPAHGAGEPGVVVITLRDPQGQPMADEPIVASFCPAPAVRPTEDRGRRRVMLVSQPMRALPPARTDAKGLARVPFELTKADGPCSAITLQVRGLKAEMHVPLHKVRGSLLAFHSLNHRANGASGAARPWLVRRIEINAIRLAGMLEGLEAPKEMAGCDTNDYSRRHLNGAPDQEGDAPREAPPALKLAPADLVALRKIWELGCEEILMQTVVQLDGDVVTRLADDAATEEATLIHRIHAEGVRVATQSWQHLVDSLSSFARAFFG